MEKLVWSNHTHVYILAVNHDVHLEDKKVVREVPLLPESLKFAHSFFLTYSSRYEYVEATGGLVFVDMDKPIVVIFASYAIIVTSIDVNDLIYPRTIINPCKYWILGFFWG